MIFYLPSWTPSLFRKGFVDLHKLKWVDKIIQSQNCEHTDNPVSILHKSIAGRYRPVSVADGPITARCRFINNAIWEYNSEIGTENCLLSNLSKTEKSQLAQLRCGILTT